MFKRLRASFRSFREGLNRHLLVAYWIAIKDHAWETLWGAGVIGISFGLLTLYYSPALNGLGWIFAAMVFLAGYNAWRSDHARLTPVIAVTSAKLEQTPVMGMVYNTLEPSEQWEEVLDTRTFIQLLPRCLTDSPVYDCRGFLKAVERFIPTKGIYEPIDLSAMALKWSHVADVQAITLHPGVETPLNIAYISHDNEQMVPCVFGDLPMQRIVDSFVKRHDAQEESYRFHVTVTCSERSGGHSMKPVNVGIQVTISDDFAKPFLEVIQLP